LDRSRRFMCQWESTPWIQFIYQRHIIREPWGMPSKQGIGRDSGHWFLALWYLWNANFELKRTHFKKMLKRPKNVIPNGCSLNVKYRKTNTTPLKALKISTANWKKKFDKRTNPNGKEYYCLPDEFELLRPKARHRWIRLVAGLCLSCPTQFDLTRTPVIQNINNWETKWLKRNTYRICSRGHCQHRLEHYYIFSYLVRPV